jgi:hypothetical protein
LETEAREWRVLGQPGSHSKTLSQNKKLEKMCIKAPEVKERITYKKIEETHDCIF